MPALNIIDGAGRTSEAITLANEIATHFIESTLSIHPDGAIPLGATKIVSSGIATVRGKLNLSHQETESKVIVDCSFCVPLHWLRTAPALRCSARWIRRPNDRELRANWHINDDDSLCYVLNLEWKDCLADIHAKHPDLTVQCAAFYCVNNARWLLYRHLEGYRRRLKDWPPKEWPCWPHSVAGLRAYLAQRRHQHFKQ